MPPRKPDPKADSLRQQGCLHPHPEKVSDELFNSTEFFDPRDLLQVKYEMLRRVRVDGRTVSRTAASFGLSRPSFYRAQEVYEEGGLPALLPRRPGPRRAHKLSEKVVEALRETLDQEPDSTFTPALVVTQASTRARGAQRVQGGGACRGKRPRPGDRGRCAPRETCRFSACQ